MIREGCKYNHGTFRAVTRTLTGGVYFHIIIHILCSARRVSFQNQFQIDEFEKKSVTQNMNI